MAFISLSISLGLLIRAIVCLFNFFYNKICNNNKKKKNGLRCIIKTELEKTK